MKEGIFKCWLLVALWMVVHSTGTPTYKCEEAEEGIAMLGKEVCEDSAEALNQAHRSRTLAYGLKDAVYDPVTWCKSQNGCAWTGVYCLCTAHDR